MRLVPQANDFTRVFSESGLCPQLASFESMFGRVYEAIHSTAPGASGSYLGFACNASGAVVSRGAFGPDKNDDFGALISIGRHTDADWSIQDDEALALRHAVLHVRTDAVGPRIRVIDLRAGSGIHLPGEDTPWATLLGDHELVFRLGATTFFLLPSDDLETFKALGEREAWTRIRTSAVGQPRGARRVRPEVQITGSSGIWHVATNVFALRGAHVTELLNHDALRPDDAVASIQITDTDSRTVHWLAQKDLNRGVLVGRYPRCDVVIPEQQSDVSRVHLLIFQHQDHVIAFDVGSTFGTHVDKVPCRVVDLRCHHELLLGGCRRLRFSPLDMPRDGRASEKRGHERPARRAICLGQGHPQLADSISLEIAHDVMSYAHQFALGQRGYLRSGYGNGDDLYNYHVEVPFDGIGVPVEAVLVVETSEQGKLTKTPYREWCRSRAVSLICPRCGGDVAGPNCAGRP